MEQKKKGRRDIFDWEAKQVYLKELAETGRKTDSATIAGTTLGTLRRARESDPNFADDEKDAMELYRDTLRKELHRRAVKGVPKPVYYQGEEVGVVLQYSDKLLELEIKRHCPEYRDNSTVDVNVAGGVLVVQPKEEPENADVWAERANSTAKDN